MDDHKYYVITNNCKGGRMILTPEGGATVFAKESRTFKLTENELKMAKPYFDNKDLSYREATTDEVKAMEQVGTGLVEINATPSSDGAQQVGGIADDLSEPTNAEEETLDERDVTNVKHLGFGRYYGMKGDERVTDAMTKAEGQAYAQEHGVPMGDDPDPVAEAAKEDGTPPAEATTPPDETQSQE